MSTFASKATGVQFSVDDSKDDRYVDGYERADQPARKAPAKKAASSKSEK